LPGILVPIAYSMHIFSLRQILTRKKMHNPAKEKADLRAIPV